MEEKEMHDQDNEEISKSDSEISEPLENGKAENAHELRVMELEKQLKEKEDKYLYLYAEFDNFRKRSIKERAEVLKFGWEPAAHDLLHVLDNLERAMDQVPEGVDPAWAEGLRMTLEQFKSEMKKHGLEDIQAMHQIFDPHKHEAVAQEASEHSPGVVLKEHTRGYTLHGRLLRASRVTVSTGNNS
jgi:molecular chaperone GrpE